MSRLAIFPVFIVLLFPHVSWCDAPEPAILQPGEYHGDEISVDTSVDWWGLYIDRDGPRLERVEVTVERIHDLIVDTEGESTGKLVSVVEAEEPVFLLSGVRALREGPIHSAFDGRRFIYPGEMLPIGKDGAYRSFVAASGRAIAGEHGSRFEDYGLTLWYWGGGRPVQQEFAKTGPFSVDGAPELLWAGDLDGDERPDLIFDLHTHYNVSELALFLSSEAVDGEAVAEVARLVTTGC